MRNITRFTVKTSQNMPKCTKNHNIPAIVFSIAGYTGNHFHDFSDVLIPLFDTSREFNSEVLFLMSDKGPDKFDPDKFQRVLKALSNYDAIDIDKEGGVLCFPKMIVGLKSHKELTIVPSTSQHSMKDFKEFLRNVYSLKRQSATKLRQGEQKRPRILLITRMETRAFVNKDKIAKMARRLGFEVKMSEADSNLTRFSQVVNSCDVLIGVHGAGLTNMVFLPENGILIQVVPLGRLEGIAKSDYGEPAISMNLKYLEYRISEEESSLREEYPIDHQVFRNPKSYWKMGWGPFSSVYLYNQNVTLDVRRFESTLLEGFLSFCTSKYA